MRLGQFKLRKFHRNSSRSLQGQMGPETNEAVLGDGLVLRWSTAADTERIATLHSLVHREQAEAPPNTNVIIVCQL
jgi:hypothetical protein